MKRALKGLEIALMISSPFVIYYLFLNQGYNAAFFFVIGAILIVRAPRIASNKRLTKSLFIQMALIGAYFIFGMIYKNIVVVELLPAFINTTLFFVFGYTYLHPPSMIESFAQTYIDRELTEAERAHCRFFTLVWMIFFVVDMVAIVYVALYMTPLEWAFLVGVINYALMGLIFAVEYIVRKIRFT